MKVMNEKIMKEVEFENESKRNFGNEEINKLNKHPGDTVNNRLDQVQERLSEPEDRYFKMSQAGRERGRERERGVRM
jgi:hypothetical protein